jgi:hypothetical protein
MNSDASKIDGAALIFSFSSSFAVSVSLALSLAMSSCSALAASTSCRPLWAGRQPVSQPRRSRATREGSKPS